MNKKNLAKSTDELKRSPRFVMSDLELVWWAFIGFLIGLILQLVMASVIIMVLVVLAAIIRLYIEGVERNLRPSIGMVPVFLL